LESLVRTPVPMVPGRSACSNAVRLQPPFTVAELERVTVAVRSTESTF
jgi:hypothetical protein